MRTGVKIVAWWIALVLVSAVMANLIVLFLDGTARKKYEMGAHNATQAKDRVTACAMRIHTMEQEQDMLRLRVEELEERLVALEDMVYGFHPTNKTVKDASQWTCVYHNWTGDEDD